MNEIIPQTEIAYFHQMELFRKPKKSFAINRNHSEARKTLLSSIGIIPKPEKVFCHQSELFRSLKKYFVTNRNYSEARKSILSPIGIISKPEKVICHQSEPFRKTKSLNEIETAIFCRIKQKEEIKKENQKMCFICGKRFRRGKNRSIKKPKFYCIKTRLNLALAQFFNIEFRFR